MFSGFGNPGRSYNGSETVTSKDVSLNLSEVLKDHYDPELAMTKLAEVHNWLKEDMSEEERAKLRWKQAYNLTTWEEFPGEIVSASNVILSRLGIKSGGGNNSDAVQEAKAMRGMVRRKSSLLLSETDKSGLSESDE